MTWKELLEELRELAEADGALDEPVCMPDLLDNCATVGLSGASGAYVEEVGRPAKKGKKR